MDFSIRLKKGLELKGFISSPGEKSRATIVFVHGLGEHIQRYTDWSGRFVREGIGFAGVDLPGHGRSAGKRGYIRSFSQTDEMIDILLENVTKTFPGVPAFIYGHSLGGCIVLDYLLRKNPSVKGAIITSPWLKLSFEPDKLKVLAASVMTGILPALTQQSGLVVEHISHDPEVVRRYREDPLVHDRISVSLFGSAIKAARNSLAHASDLRVPLLLIHGCDDHICSPEGSREFAARTNLAELVTREGGFHELHNELFKSEIFTLILGWMNKKLA